MADSEERISADEIALYDRQIRLWGMQAQKRIGSANILLITMKSLANEVAKNLVLAGIGSLTIIDHERVTSEDLQSQFFLEAAIQDPEIVNQGINRAEAAGPQVRNMNPRVKLNIDKDDIRTKQPDFYAQFSVIIATELDYNTNSAINAACRVANRPFYAAGLHGLYGYVFADLISHEFVIERNKSNVPAQTQETPTRVITNITTKKEGDKVIELVTKRETYTPLLLANASPLPEEYTRVLRKRKQVTPLLSCLRALWEFEKVSGHRPTFSPADLGAFTKLAIECHQELKLESSTLDSTFLRTFLQNLGNELPPVAAFLGGSLAQDVINVLSAREQPIQNLLLFDADKSVGPIYPLHPFFDEIQVADLAAVPPVANPIPIHPAPATAGEPEPSTNSGA